MGLPESSFADCGSQSRKRVSVQVTVVAVILALLLAGAGDAAEPGEALTRAAFDRWLERYRDAKPEFKPGDVLGVAELEKIRRFLPPGYFEELNFPELRMPIIAARDHTPRRDFLACTEKHQRQVKLKSDGTLEGYVCGQPFANAELKPEDPLAGGKAAWNFDCRWQNYGLAAIGFMFVFDEFGGRHDDAIPVAAEMPPRDWMLGLDYRSSLPKDLSQNFGGGGRFTRTISGFYRRVYFSHLAQREGNGGTLNVTDANRFFWKEFLGFLSPFDMRGRALIDYRYADPSRPVDAWVYALRRIRRVSIEETADIIIGSDQTIDDFYSFWGRSVQWNWRFLGWKKLLSVMDSSHDYIHLYGPNGDLLDDVRSLRSFAVVERTPKLPDMPYSSVVMFWDSENWQPWLAIAFDRTGNLWRVWTFQGHWSEDFHDWAELSRGTQTTVIQTQILSDYRVRRATILTGLGAGNPDASDKDAATRFDPSSLESIHP